MTDEMIVAAHRLHEAAKEYRKLYEAEHGATPVIWLTHDEGGESVFMAESFNADRIKNVVGVTHMFEW